MSFIDTIKDIFTPRDDDAYADDYYDEYEEDYYEEDDYYEDEGYSREPHARESATARQETQTSLLGNTPRPRVESVSVYTRSGHLVDGNAGDDDPAAPAPFERNSAVTDDASWTDSRLDYTPIASSNYGPQPVAARLSPEAAEVPSVRVTSSNLPSYVLVPTAYEDVQTLVRRVRTNQPVVLDLRQLDIEIAKRIVDFSYGFAFGVEGAVEELDERVFAVLPRGLELAKPDVEKLAREGVIRR